MTLPGLDSRSSNAAHCCSRVWAPERRPSVRPSVHSRVCVCVLARSAPCSPPMHEGQRRLPHTWHVAELWTHHVARAAEPRPAYALPLRASASAAVIGAVASLPFAVGPVGCLALIV
jgi:hypothetical protein